MCAMAALIVGVVACATAPKTVADRQALEREASSSLQLMRQKDPGLDQLLQSSAGYVVFPSVGKGAFIAGGAHGRGILFQQGSPVGYVNLSQASLGLQAGAASFTELLVFADQGAVERLKAGTFQLGANITAIVLTAGASGNATFSDGVAVFTMQEGGLMAGVSVSGQQLKFEPLSG